MKLFKSKYFLLILGSALFLSIACIHALKTYTISDLSQSTSDKLSSKYNELKAASDKVKNNQLEALSDLYNKEHIGVYIYRKNTLVYWNNSQIPVPEKIGGEFKSNLASLRNGYYLCYSAKNNDDLYVTLCPVKTKYELQNDYLKNSFAAWLDLPSELDLKLSNTDGAAVTINEVCLFSLVGSESAYRSTAVILTMTILFFLGVISYLMFVILQIKNSPFSISNFFYVGFLFLFRFIMLEFKWPDFLYQGDLYNLRLFGNADSFFNSYLGDLVLNSLLLIWLSISCYYCLKAAQQKTPKVTCIILTILLLFGNLIFHHHIFNSIITNSTLSFDFLNILNLSWYTYVALIPIVLVNISILILSYILIKYSLKRSFKAVLFYIGTIIGISLVLILLSKLFPVYITPYHFLIEKWWYIVVGLLVLGVAQLNLEKNILAVGGLLLVMAMTSSAILNFYISKNQSQDFEVLSYELTGRQDAVLESEFYNLSEKIEKNEPLINLSQFVAYNGDKEFLQLLKQNFFFGYFDRYNIEFSMFDENCTALIKNPQAILLNEGFFEEQIRHRSIKTSSPNFFFNDQYKENSRYIARVQLGKNKLYILFEPKFFEEVGAFPDLLIDESQQKQGKLRNLSYAVYRSGINNKMYGDFSYPVSLNDSTKLNKTKSIYTHHFSYPDENSTVIISTKTKNLGYYFSYNSYLFLFFSLIAYLSYIFYSLFFSDRFQTSSLTRRVQTTVILLLLLSITAVGITSSKLVSDQFDKDNEKQLQEKSNTILSELSGLLQNSDSITDIPKELIDLTIKKYAYVFNSEISLFSNTGGLYITSQPRLYELGLAAPFLNPEAFAKLKNDLVSTYCLKDMAGNLNYLSLYAPIYNTNKKLLGYLNLPYFGKQSVLINELSGIISTLINVYVILFIISILSGLILSGYITLPLRILKQQMAMVSLGSKNEAIVWESDDEVGKLVSEYNSMIDKLDKSAGLLAKSEREIAWREMAKQVAHEIKNPLTPMKLNIQYLQHIIKNDPAGFEERFTKASNGIIEQIDALANIATEFSNFAKLPSGELEKINLAEVIYSTVNLFAKEKNIKITVNLHSKDILILANKEQMLRVFNNLLKNSIQATSEMPDPHIEIKSIDKDGKYLITVSDNGCGIPEELKQNIFTPNFTTKSTGSGLGLAMIKNIFETINAQIWFESMEHKGTIFYLEFKQTND